MSENAGKESQYSFTPLRPPRRGIGVVTSYGPFSGTTPSCLVLAKPNIQVFGTDFWLGKIEHLD